MTSSKSPPRATVPRATVPAVPPAALDLQRFFRPGDGVLWGQGAGEPLALTAALAEQSGALGGVEAFTGLIYSTHLAGVPSLRLRSYGVLSAPESLNLEVVPCHVSALPRLIRSGRIRCDVVFCQVSPADQNGMHSLGVSVDYLAAALDVARHVVAEVNEQMPLTEGPVRVHSSRFDASVGTDRELISVLPRPPSPAETRIAAHVAGLIEDGSTIQLGIGALAAAIASALTGHRGLRVYSGLVEDWLVDLVESGVVDSPPNGAHMQPNVAGTAVGTERLYNFLHRNAAVQMLPVDQTHGPHLASRSPRFVAVNSALEVDLTGQVNAECVAGRYVGAVGGQVDFLRAAAAAPDGRGVIALPSTTWDGARSRIVGQLGGPVTASRADVDYVVTEHGVAHLQGCTLKQRALALIGVADPRHRDQLADAAQV